MWRRIWGPRPADAANERESDASLVKHFIRTGLFLDRLLGDYACGMVALEAYFETDGGEVTAEYVSHRLDGLFSEDTARRRLNEMRAAGVVIVRKEGRTSYFRLDHDIAASAIAFMKGEPVMLPSSKPQLAVNS